MKFSFFLILFLSACSTLPKNHQDIQKWTALPMEDQLKAFKSDACSLWPEGPNVNKGRWLECCVLHDYDYWKGGTRSERRASDRRLRSCVEEKDEAPMAAVMYLGVRMGGGAHYKSQYRWGFGWKYPRGYLALTEQDKSFIRALGPSEKSDLRDYIDPTKVRIDLKQLAPMHLKSSL